MSTSTIGLHSIIFGSLNAIAIEASTCSRAPRLEIYGYLLNTIRAAWSGIGARLLLSARNPVTCGEKWGFDHGVCNCSGWR